MELETLYKFADSLQENFSLPGAASPEDQLKIPVVTLFKEIGSQFGIVVNARTESHVSNHSIRPDIAIYTKGLVCGHVELKAPGLGADAPNLKGKHNKSQWEKLKSLPNLIYTDGRDWALYRFGVRKGSIVRLNDDPTLLGQKAVTENSCKLLDSIFRDFLGWIPIVPQKPKELSEYLAPLTRFLRSEIESALTTPMSAAALLAAEWRQYFFPDADDPQFADAYAQTVVYALLLAQLSGAKNLDPDIASSKLGASNGVLAIALKRLAQEEAREELRVGFELLQRSIQEIDPSDFLKHGPEVWLYFYEDFLAKYDPKLRKQYGVYYTPSAVVELQVRLVSELLETHFGKKLGFADDGVVFLDPAVGTGTYPVAAVKHGLNKVREKYGSKVVPGRAAQMGRNIHGFEILIGPYAVAHLRLTQALESEGAILQDRLNIFLADTLDSPNLVPPGGLTLTYKVLTQEHEAARKLKNEGDVLVCIGNPPYDRDQGGNQHSDRRKGGWVRYGDQLPGAAKQEMQGDTPIFEDFLRPAKKAGKGLHLQVIFNDYVYFWRWALWRLFEQQKGGGIVSFITASSYLTGKGFVGVREVMRKTFDMLWIIDLGGDNLGARKTPNVFAIQIPVAIAIGIRREGPNSEKPAIVRYTKVEAENRKFKLQKIEELESLDSIQWQDCPSDWQSPFLPEGTGNYFDWPKIVDIFPFHSAGSIFYRTWPISESPQVLESRWEILASAEEKRKTDLFRESRDRKITYTVKDSSVTGFDEPAIKDVTLDCDRPKIIRYGYRCLDRQHAFFDFRLGDFLRPDLYRIQSNNQLYLVSPDNLVPGIGPLIVSSAHIPDQHYFRGSFGGKDIIPLYRDSKSKEANITVGLLKVLSAEYDEPITAEDIAAYVYGILGGQAYSKKFWNELSTPGPRIPITKEAALFFATRNFGRKLIWLHTYGERFSYESIDKEVPAGKAQCIFPISDDPEKYPESFEWNSSDMEIRVGSGRFGPVSREAWNYEVSGLKVLQSWLDYRMKNRAGKKSSPLDSVRPRFWPPSFTEEFLELLWVVQRTIFMEPDLAKVLDEVVSSPCFTESELPRPTSDERKLRMEQSPVKTMPLDVSID